jgi:3'(2'), 5'-bisphosphate nucleotidase
MNPARLVAMAAVRAGVAVCQRVRGGLVGTAQKADKSPVTVADFASQALICKMVREVFADDPIVAEEDSADLRGEAIGFVLRQVGASLGQEVSEREVKGWIDLGQEVQEKAGLGLGRYWTVGPIDGTKGFLRGGQYAVALALVEAGRVVLGVLGCRVWPVA